MRKPPAIIPPAAPKTAPKTAPKATPPTRPQTVSAATIPPPAAASVKRASKAVSPKPILVTATKTVPAKAAAPKPTSAKISRSIPVKVTPPQSVPVRVIAETPATYFAGTGGQAWRMTSRYAIAYVRDAVLAGELLATEPRYLAKAAMAVYYDRKGKAFAWQFRFDTARWAEVVGRLG